MDLDGGNLANLTNHSAHDDAPSWSPDGTRIAFYTTRDGNGEIYVMDVDGGNLTRLTNQGAVDYAPKWSPDGYKIVYQSDVDGDREIFVMYADGTEQTQITHNTTIDEGANWSPDGTKIAFRSERNGNGEIYVMSADGSNVVRLTDHPADDGGPSWSPEGSRIAFHSSRDGNYEIYVMDADGGGLTRLTADPALDEGPVWSPVPGLGVRFDLVAEGPNSDCSLLPPFDCITLTAGLAAGATEGLDLELGEVERPPLPPTSDIFDVRFIVPGIEGLLLDLREPDVEAPEWQIAVQAGFGGYPISLSWNPAAMPEGSWRMRSLDGGQAIDVSMNTTSSVAITDPTVTRLAIALSTSTTVSVTYGQRWNMVSLPVIPEDITYNVLFPDAISAFAFSGGYQQVTQLEPCTGYWLNLADGGTYELTGAAVFQCERTLPERWSLQGVPLRGTKVDDIVQSPASNLLSVFGFEGAYIQKADQNLLAEGRGFWFNLSTVGQVILNSDPGGAARVLPAASGDVAGAVLWAQSGDRRQEIRLGVEPDQVTELPPVPPAGVLDARVQVADLSSLQVPRSGAPADYVLTVQGADVQLGWDVPAQQEGRWALVLGDQSLVLSGQGTLALGELTAKPAVLTLQQLGGAPVAYALHHSFPNPFNPSTTIRYELVQDAPVTLRVYDITGQLVREIVSEVQRAGSHQAAWDGRDTGGRVVSSGVYLYELQAGGYRAVRKMLFVK